MNEEQNLPYLARLNDLAFEDDAFDIGSSRDEIIAAYNAVYSKEDFS